MSDVTALKQLVIKYNQLKEEVAKVIIGQEKVVEDVLNAVFSGGHVLLIGVPGLAKTLLVHTVADALGLDFKRIQFTPDLMPSDILGSEVLNKAREFEFIPGPVFSNLVLADEINRTPPKTQAALLEAMQEKGVTIAGKRYPLQEPYFVLATQNPIEQEGTYPLPEAQLDRFMFAIELDYPSFEEEIAIVKSTTKEKTEQVRPLFTAKEVLEYQRLIRRIPVADNVVEYAVSIVSKTRPNTESATDLVKKYIDWGAGPRASQNLIIAAKTRAALQGKISPDQEDVRAVALEVLQHRLLRNYRAEADAVSMQDIVQSLL